MFSSGGNLNLGKCFWYFIAWKWTDGIPLIANINDYPGELQILSGSNPTPVTIDRIEASSALETLGLFTSPSGQNIKQFQETSEKLLSHVSTVWQTPLCTFEADMILPIYIHPGLCYIFAGTTFDEDTCKVSIDSSYPPSSQKWDTNARLNLLLCMAAIAMAEPNFQPAGIFKNPPISPCSSVTFN
jgi:hypothetical protein